ncbi:MAG: hypothetical protein WC334_03495 [Kiritimatiellales bacterium]|jgi:hypothetical protein
MSNKAIELHDSKIEAVHQAGDHLEIHFNKAYVYEWSGVLGDNGTGWGQCARFVLYSPFLLGRWPVFPESIKSGVLEVGETVYDNVISLPLDVSEIVKLSLSFFSKEEVIISASRIEIYLEGEAEYIETVPFQIFEKEVKKQCDE